MWVPPDTTGLAPGYEQRDVSADFKADELFPLASGREPDAAITHPPARRDACGSRDSRRAHDVAVPDAPFVHVFVARGGVDLDGAGALHAGDAARLTAAGASHDHRRRPTAPRSVIWETHAEDRSDA